jgi:sodium/potassium-transporting ATPase subunit alpha
MITIIAGFLGLLFVLLAKFVVGYSIFECMIFGIGIIVANVP